MIPASNRRGFLRSTLAGALAAGGVGRLGTRTALARAEAEFDAAGSEPSLIVRSLRPLDAETPVSVFDQPLTPNRLFFVRSHFGPPAEGLAAPWKLEIAGGVRMPRTFSMDDLAKLEQVTIPAVLQCSGNGRAFYAPTVPGVAWEKGAVGNAEWTGVRLLDVLNFVGVQPGQAHVHLHGADAPPSPKTPAFLRSLPIGRAAAASTLLATKMNGEALPHLHGGPIRLVVPGWAGNHWIKWLRKLVVAVDEAPGFYQRTGYKMPKNPVPPGTEVKPEDLVPVTTLNVKSLIAWPGEGAMLPPGRHEIRGVAWTGGEATIAKVEVAAGTNPNAWQPAVLVGAGKPYAWQAWKFVWEAKSPGRVALRVRATDSTGSTQPETSPWNKSGYLWNGIDQVTCEVR